MSFDIAECHLLYEFSQVSPSEYLVSFGAYLFRKLFFGELFYLFSMRLTSSHRCQRRSQTEHRNHSRFFTQRKRLQQSERQCQITPHQVRHQFSRRNSFQCDPQPTHSSKILWFQSTNEPKRGHQNAQRIFICR